MMRVQAKENRNCTFSENLRPKKPLISPGSLDKFCPLVLKLLSSIEILTSIKGHNSVTNLQKMTVHNPNLNLVNHHGNISVQK